MTHKRWTRRGAALALLPIILGLATACGSSGGGSPSGGSASSGSSTGVSTANAIVARYADAGKGIGITTPLAHPVARNKTVYYVECCGLTGAIETKYASEAAQALGWKFKSISTNGTPQSLLAGWQQAANAPDVSAVLGDGVTNQLIAGPLATLQKEHAPVVLWGNVQQPTGPILAELANTSFIRQVADMEAAWMVSRTNGKANVAFFTVPSLPVLPPLTSEFKAEMARLCSTCSVSIINEPITALGSDLPSRISGYLQSHPAVNYMGAGWDDMLVGVPQALSSAGLASQVSAIGYAPGTTANLQYVKNGQVEKALIPYPYWSIVWRAFDILARHFNSESIQQDLTASLPLTYMTSGKIGNPNTPVVLDPQYQAKFKKLWGVG